MNSTDHIAKYSHPCRFNELCRNKDTEPHLVHELHNVPTCSKDEHCSEKDDPVHRATYRHTGFPDYLVSCRYQKDCRDKSSKHRIKYFHGETLPSIGQKPSSVYNGSVPLKKSNMIQCKYGNECRLIKNPQHAAKYSHPAS